MNLQTLKQTHSKLLTLYLTIWLWQCHRHCYLFPP